MCNSPDLWSERRAAAALEGSAWFLAPRRFAPCANQKLQYSRSPARFLLMTGHARSSLACVPKQQVFRRGTKLINQGQRGKKASKPGGRLKRSVRWPQLCLSGVDRAGYSTALSLPEGRRGARGLSPCSGRLISAMSWSHFLAFTWDLPWALYFVDGVDCGSIGSE